MSFRAVNEYLNYSLKDDEEKRLYEEYMATYIELLTTRGLKDITHIYYKDLRNKIWGIQETQEDSRTADEIIRDTVKKHRLKIEEA